MSRYMEVVLFKLWMDKRNLAERSKILYASVIKRFLTTRPDVNDPESYLNFLIETAVKKRMYQNKAAILKYLDFAIEDKTLKSTIVKLINDRGISQREPEKYANKTPLSEEEVSLVLNNLKDEKHKIMTLIMIETGLRIGDILNIKKDFMVMDKFDVYSGLKITTTAKGGKQRLIWMFNLEIAKIVLDFVNTKQTKTDFIFVDFVRSHTDKGNAEQVNLKVLNYYTYWKDLKAALIESDIDRHRFAPHSFRRIYARKAWELTHDLHTVKELLGHANVETTLRYLKTFGFDIASKQLEMQLGIKILGDKNDKKQN